MNQIPIIYRTLKISSRKQSLKTHRSCNCYLSCSVRILVFTIFHAVFLSIHALIYKALGTKTDFLSRYIRNEQ